VKHKFVEYMPTKLEDNTLYISIEYDIAKHKCACGCGDEIVTTLSPARWQLIYDGETVSLTPSIGNWNHDCNSHYFIKKDKVIWAGDFSKKQIENVINNDKEVLEKHIQKHKKHGFVKTFIERIKNLFRNN